MTDEEILNQFNQKMLDNMEDLDLDYQKIIDDNYWELLEE